MRHLSAIAIGLIACTNPPEFHATGPSGLHVELVRRHVSEVLEGVVTADTELAGVELVLPNQTAQLQGFASGGNRPFSVPVTTLAEGEHTLVVRGTLNGGLVEESTSFRVDRRHPVLALRPPATLIVGETILLAFSEPMALETIDRGLRVRGADSWSWSASDESTLLVSLEWGFRAPAKVTLDLTTALTDTAGLGLVEPVTLEIDFIDRPDGGSLVWADKPATGSTVTTLQPRSAIVDCLAFEEVDVATRNRQTKLVHFLHFFDAGVQPTYINEGFPVPEGSRCTLNKPGPEPEVFLIQDALRSLDVLSGDGTAASFRRIGQSIVVGAMAPGGLGPPTPQSPAAARLVDGRVIATNGARLDPQFWIFGGGAWAAIPAPPGAGAFMAIHAYRDSLVVLAHRSASSTPPVVAWVWRAEQWVEIGFAPNRSRCCVSSNRLLCLNEDLSVVELSERSVEVVGQAPGGLARPFRIADTRCFEEVAVWALDGDVIEARDREVSQRRLPSTLGATVVRFSEGTTWLTQGARMFRPAKR